MTQLIMDYGVSECFGTRLAPDHPSSPLAYKSLGKEHMYIPLVDPGIRIALSIGY